MATTMRDIINDVVHEYEGIQLAPTSIKDLTNAICDELGDFMNHQLT